MDSKTPEEKVEDILSDAFEKTKAILDDQVRLLMATRPEHYEKFVFQVGWGFDLYLADGKTTVDSEDADPEEKAVLALAETIYNRLGADNSQILAADVEPAPPVAIWSPSQSSEGTPVFVHGLCDDRNEGRPDDLRVRPVSNGLGPYLLVVSPKDVYDEEGNRYVHPAPTAKAPRLS